MISNDIQPVANLRVLGRVGSLYGPGAAEKTAGKEEWVRHFINGGFTGKCTENLALAFHSIYSACLQTSISPGLEALLVRYAGKFSVGDEVTMADVLLVPQVSTAGLLAAARDHCGTACMQLGADNSETIKTSAAVHALPPAPPLAAGIQCTSVRREHDSFPDHRPH